MNWLTTKTAWNTAKKHARYGKACALAVAFSFPAAAMATDANNNDIAQNRDSLQSTARILQQAKSLVDLEALQGNTSIIKQIGDNNSASVSQLRTAGYWMGNAAYIKQRGNNNTASVDQQGGNNLGVIVQKGDNHTADIIQTGNSFSLRADIRQFGFDSDISLSQSSSGSRSISIEQQNYSGNARPVTVDTR